MSKTTRNQFLTTTQSSTFAFLIVLLLFAGFSSFAQLKVNPNTTFTANNVVSSKEEVNVFDSSILGEDQLVLNGQNQLLETAQNTSLASLRVANANELEIRAELHLRGNLVVESGILKLEQPLHIKGDLILEKDANIHNDHFLIYENKFVFEKDFASTPVVKLLQSTSFLAQMIQSESTFIIQTEKPVIGYKEKSNYQFKGKSFSPPPECKRIA